MGWCGMPGCSCCENAYAAGFADGFKTGFSVGYARGHRAGYVSGYIDGYEGNPPLEEYRSDIERSLSSLQTPPVTLEEPKPLVTLEKPDPLVLSCGCYGTCTCVNTNLFEPKVEADPMVSSMRLSCGCWCTCTCYLKGF